MSYHPLTLLTVATSMRKEVNRFCYSAMYYGYAYKVLGLGEKPPPLNEDGSGLGWKITLVQRELETYPENHIILFTDCYDVMLIAPPRELLHKYMEMQHPVVFSTESNCWPDEARAADYPPHDTPFRFLNSGGYIARAGHLREMLKSLNVSAHDDDQRVFTNIYLEKPGSIKLDHECQIFQSLLEPGDRLRWAPKPLRLQNVLTGTRPCVLHGNGGSENKLNQLARMLPPSRDHRPEIFYPKRRPTE